VPVEEEPEIEGLDDERRDGPGDGGNIFGPEGGPGDEAAGEAREAGAFIVEAEGNEAAEPEDAEDNADVARNLGEPLRGDKRHWRRGYAGLHLETLNEMARQNGYSDDDRPVCLTRLRKKDKVVVFNLVDKDIETSCWAALALTECHRSPEQLLAGQQNFIEAYLFAHGMEDSKELVPAGELAKLLVQLRNVSYDVYSLAAFIYRIHEGAPMSLPPADLVKAFRQQWGDQLDDLSKRRLDEAEALLPEVIRREEEAKAKMEDEDFVANAAAYLRPEKDVQDLSESLNDWLRDAKDGQLFAQATMAQVLSVPLEEGLDSDAGKCPPHWAAKVPNVVNLTG
jgi:hypothetical protein